MESDLGNDVRKITGQNYIKENPDHLIGVFLYRLFLF